MIFQIGPKHVRIDNFHGEIGSFSYYVLGNLVQIYAATGDIFYVYYRDVTDPSTGTAFATLNAFIAYLDTNFFKSGAGSGSGTAYAGVSTGSRYLFTTANQTSLDWESRQLLTGNGAKSVDWGTRALYNSAGNKVIDYESLYLADYYGINSVNFNQRLLQHQNGTRAVFWADGRNSMHDVNGLIGVIWGNTTAFAPYYSGVYAERTLVDGTYWSGRGAVSLDWKNRYLVDGNESIVAMWNDRLLVHYGVSSIDWGSRQLLDSSGTQAHSWQSRHLYDTSAVPAVDYGLRVLNDAWGSPAIDWRNRSLISASGVTALSWGSSLNGNGEVLRFSWGTRLELDAGTLTEDSGMATSGGVQTGNGMEPLHNYYGVNNTHYLAEPKRWMRIDGSDNQQYYLPLY
jgi:hypothetical protein